MFIRPLLAHSENDSGETHLLTEHLKRVAELARKFADKFSFGQLGYYAGLFHDLGKSSGQFQRYIRSEAAKGGDHKGAGALLVVKVAELLAIPLVGHHGGLPDHEHAKNLLRAVDAKALQTAEEQLTELEHEVNKFQPDDASWLDDRLEVEFFIRMIFSALVDADFLDTEAHFKPALGELRKRSWAISDLWDSLEESQNNLSGKKENLVNRERHRIYLSCLEAAEGAQGFFRLTVPTGGGKTRSAMAFALKHALKHGLDRVIMAIPYTSITEQTAKEYRVIFGEENILEHHSGAAWHEEDDERGDGCSWSRLASENWDAPIIVTTNVQLFESLLGNKPSVCRKLHNIAGSVIILDEVQTLPLRLLDPTLDVLRKLAERYRVTVVLCTATQPAFEANPIFDDIPDIREIVPDTREMFKRLARVAYQFPSQLESWDWDRVAEEMRSEEQALTVVNTKAHALALFQALDDPEALYLTTQLCGAHRQEIVTEVKRRLAKGEPCRLVSTQVVEAGVDIDFPLVLRAIGPLDRIIQAAGRCNREGKLEQGRVVVFKPTDDSMPPGEYRTAADITKMLIGEGDFDPDDPATIDRYSQYLLKTVSTDRQVEGTNIQGLRRKLNYPKVAESYRLIPDSTTSVIVKYNDDAKNWIEKLREAHPARARHIIRKLQPYTVGLYQNQFSRAVGMGLVSEVKPGLFIWTGRYDDKTGILLEGYRPEELIT